METYSKIFKILFIAYGIIVFTLLSCDGGHQIDYNLKTNFIYKNLTSEDLEIILYDKENTKFQTYSIESNKEIKILIERDGEKTGIGQPFRMENDSRYIATKVTIKFITSNKCLSFSTGEGLLNEKLYDNFSETMYNTSNNTLIYNIDSVELSNATNCL
jgi:hypothetical protein|nr:hypothetical protein [uncultured Flavobacterium sp.]